MKNENESIDNFFREKLNGLEAEPAGNLWRRLYFLLVYKKMVVATFIVLFLAAGIMFFISGNDTSTAVSGKHKNSFAGESVESVEIEIPSNQEDLSGQYNQSQAGDKPTLNLATDKQSRLTAGETAGKKHTVKLTENRIKQTGSKENTISAKAGMSVRTGANSVNSVKDNFNNSNKRFTSTMKMLAANTIVINNKQRIAIAANPISSSGEPEERDPNPTEKKVNWYAGLAFNPAYSVTQQSCQCNSPDDPYNSGKTENIFTSGGSLNITASANHFFIRSGAGYSYYGYDAKYSVQTDKIDHLQSYYIYDSTWVWIYNPPEQYPVLVSVDSSFVAVYQKDDRNTNIRFRYLEIPLMTGYCSDKSKKSGFEISTGLSFGFLISAKGVIPSPYENSYLELTKSSPFIRTGNINYILRLGYWSRLSEKTNFFIRPFYKRSLKSSYEKSLPVKQNFNTFGVSFGIDFKL